MELVEDADAMDANIVRMTGPLRPSEDGISFFSQADIDSSPYYPPENTILEDNLRLIQTTVPSASLPFAMQVIAEGLKQEVEHDVSGPTVPYPAPIKAKKPIFSNPNPFADNSEPSSTVPSPNSSVHRSEASSDMVVESGTPDLDDVAPDSSDDGLTPRASIDGGVDGPSSLHEDAAGDFGTTRLSPVHFSRPSLPFTRSISFAASARSYMSLDYEWNGEELRMLSDAVREDLGQYTLPQDRVEGLLQILRELISIEESHDENEMFSISVIAQSRFDKMFDHLHAVKNHDIWTGDMQFKEILVRSGILENHWRQRLKENYFSMNDLRADDMRRVALRDMRLNPGDRKDGVLWLTDDDGEAVKPAKGSQSGNMTFTAGDWWLNIYCAQRDGIIGAQDSPVTKGPLGPTALVLSMGEEIDGPVLDTYEYTRVGSYSDMLFCFMTHRQPIRVLRAHTLKSKYAPKFGVRYDGLYLVKGFGYRLINERTNTYKCTLELHREKKQNSTSMIMHIPWPSQVDTYECFDKMVGDDFRQRKGKEEYQRWRAYEAEQEEEKQEFLKSRALHEGFRKYTLVLREAGEAAA